MRSFPVLFIRILSFAAVTSLLLVIAISAGHAADVLNHLDLAGPWKIRLDPDDVGVRQQWFHQKWVQRMSLPGSLQEQGFGDDVSVETALTGSIIDQSWFTAREYAKYRRPDNVKVPFWLQPEKHFVGVAWYQRTVHVPGAWKGKRITLVLERCHWQTTLWVDGEKTGSAESLSTPHSYVLPRLKPGPHRLAIRVDNRLIVNVGEMPIAFPITRSPIGTGSSASSNCERVTRYGSTRCRSTPT